MTIDKKLLDILVCPICKKDLDYQEDVQELICRLDKLAYPIRNDIPIMLPTEARQLRDSEG